MQYLLHHNVEESAQRDPQHPAMRFNGDALTYADLSQRSNQLANLLHAQGVGKGDRVGVFLDKSLETVLAIYGIMKAGAAYVPLDPRSPVSRLVTIIHDCQLKGIISQDNKASVLSEVCEQQGILQFIVGLASVENINCRVFLWDDVASMAADKAPHVRIIDQDLAYIMYTSGSTGNPKGIMHTHYSGLSYARMSAETYEVNHQDVLSNHSPLHFDMSTFDYLTGPLCGATTIIIPEAYTLFPVNLAQLIETERMTIWYSVPFALIQLLMRGGIEQRDFSSLRWILYGGEPFARNHLRALMEQLPQARISNVYGPAEVNQCTYYHLPLPAEWEDVSSVPIGIVWDNAEGMILDDDDNIVSQGGVGELVVRTPTMMRGYWNRPDLNQRAFYLRDIFTDYSEKFYRTGDLVREGMDGQLEFLGRKDHQVKVRGYRVELAEVDHALNSHDAVEEGIAYIVKAEDETAQIEAAITLVDSLTYSENDLFASLRQQLPAYAVPQRIHIVNNFPRTGTGKIDRKAIEQHVMLQTSSTE